MKNRRSMKVFARILFLMLVVALGLPASGAKGASTILMPGDSIYFTIASPDYYTSSYGYCEWHTEGVGNTRCDDVWMRELAFNGSGFWFSMWTDANRWGTLEVWVDGVQYHSLSFDYYGTRNPEVTGLTPGLHDVMFRVTGTTCKDPDGPDCEKNPANDRPYSFFFNTINIYGPGDLTPPTNPASATETHGALNGVWQNTITMPEFTWPAGTDVDSGVAGYEVYFGSDPNGTSTNFQTGTTLTTTAAYADGRYYLRLRTRDNARNYAPWTSLFTFNVDTTPPVISTSHTGTAGLAGWWTTPVELSAAITDMHSGLAASSMSVDGGAAQPVAKLNFASDGQYQVVYNAADNAGNPAVPVAENVWVDQTPPVPFYNLIAAGPAVNGWYAKQVIAVAASTDAMSGIARDELHLDGAGAWAGGITMNTSGVHTLDQRVTDAAGNLATAGPDTYRIDLDLPTQIITVAPSQGQVVSNAVMDFVGNSTDGLSGLQAVEYQVDGGAWTPLAVQPTGDWEFQVNSEKLDNGMRTVAIRTVDLAGNTEYWRVDVDVQNPEPVAPLAPLVRIFSKPTATPLPSPTPTKIPSPAPVVVEEEEPAGEAAPVIVYTATATPTAAPAPVVYEEVKKQEAVNISVGISALPILGLLAATFMLYDPRPKQLNKLADIASQAAPDASGLEEVVSFVGGTLLEKDSDKGE